MAAIANRILRTRVVDLYKTLIHMGKEYPNDPKLFQSRVHNAFIKNKQETDPEKIEQLINRGEYIVKELEALYMLKKYRTLKRRYYEEDDLGRQFAEFNKKYVDGGQHSP